MLPFRFLSQACFQSLTWIHKVILVMPKTAVLGQNGVGFIWNHLFLRLADFYCKC